MSSLMVKKEFYRWITTLDKSSLCDTDKKLINLLINNFDLIAPLGTAGGSRAKKIGKLIESQQATLLTILPDLSDKTIPDSASYRSIAEIKIGPFRGFDSEETFSFNKRYTFMYGPNGSGKSSFCEGLEYALLGSIQEAESKRIDIETYIKNIQTGKVKKPVIYRLNSDRNKVEITQNQSMYRFCFIEKNRIDSFARIAATTPSNQRDRITTLFGLDAFSEFVDGFTDNFENANYLTLVNKKEEEFTAENNSYEVSKTRVEEIKNELKKLEEDEAILIKDAAKEEVTTLEELNIFLIGEDGTKGVINSLQEKKAASIPDDVDKTIISNFTNLMKKIRKSLEFLNNNILQLRKFSSEINYKNLYNTIESMAKDSCLDKSVCPACKTPIDKVVVNPFKNATSELAKMEKLVELQSEIESISIFLLDKLREMNKCIKKLNNIKKTVNNKEPELPQLTEFNFTGFSTIDSWKEKLEIELQTTENIFGQNQTLVSDIEGYSLSLQKKRSEKATVTIELQKYQVFKQRCDSFIAKRNTLEKEKKKKQDAINKFIEQNDSKLKEIDKLQNKIDINKKFVESYKKLIFNLKEYRNNLPSQLAAGLSDRTKEFFNIINGHDPDFEKLNSLKLPTASGGKITIRFQGGEAEHDALLILSEGHIKVLGLSILLSKVVNEDLGFIIFDDIVNAIDDEHRDGIAELLLKHPDLKDRQHIITCHGDMFINKLEHKLGSSVAGKEVKRYRFVPSDSIEERGIKISVGNSKHYLLLAKKALEEDARKDVAARCRQAIESISAQLWKKLDKKLNVNLTVKMRRPGARPDLASVVDSLIKELQKVTGLSYLQNDFKQLKEKYSWALLNKGIHEQDNLPEFERQDVFELLSLVENIETKVNEIQLKVSNI